MSSEQPETGAEPKPTADENAEPIINTDAPAPTENLPVSSPESKARKSLEDTDSKQKILEAKDDANANANGSASADATTTTSVKGKGKKRESDAGLVPGLSDSIEKFGNQVTKVAGRADKLLATTDKVLSKFSKSTGFRIAPIKIPLARRRQTLAVWFYTSGYLICILLNVWAFRYWTGPLFYLYLLYLLWKLIYQTFHRDGGLPIPWLRQCFFWKWFVDYFPVTLHKTVSLNPEETYLFGYHPHGIIGIGAWATFAAQTAGFPQLFRGIGVRLLTLRMNFYIPFFDWYATFMGVCDASKESCNAILSQGNSLALVLGGAKESLDAHPGQVTLYLKNRKGFVKVALENGANLVPVFGFGENELYFQVANPQGSMVRQIQDKMQRHMGFAFPLFRGRGVFQYNFGFLPRRYPINVVFGEPIKCPKTPRPEITTEMLNHYHSLYMDKLKSLFDHYKSQFYKEGATLPELLFR